MKTDYRQPTGVGDFLPYECFVKNHIENKIMECIESRGFLRVETPAIEYYALQKSGAGAVEDSKLFKFTDTDGSLLSLRADMTRPIARLVSSKLEVGGLSKFCYLANSFDMEIKNNRDREFTQAGVEIIGKDGAMIDALLIALVVDALKKSGLEDFMIDIGQVGYFKGILDELCLDADDESEIVSLVDKKDMLGLEQFAKSRGISEEGLERILHLPLLFGGEEILDAALRSASNETSKMALENLKELNSFLKTLGYNKYVSYDLSLVNGVSYYTGFVFKALTRYFGAPLCSGGRYRLNDKQGNSLPASGFAIGIGNLTKALTKCGNLPEMPKIDYVVGCDEKSFERACRYSAELTEKGLTVDNTCLRTEAELSEYKKEKRAENAAFVSEKGVKEL